MSMNTKGLSKMFACPDTGCASQNNTVFKICLRKALNNTDLNPTVLGRGPTRWQVRAEKGSVSLMIIASGGRISKTELPPVKYNFTSREKAVHEGQKFGNLKCKNNLFVQLLIQVYGTVQTFLDWRK